MNQAITALGKLDLVGAEQDSIIKLWDSEKAGQVKITDEKRAWHVLFQMELSPKQFIVEEMKNKG